MEWHARPDNILTDLDCREAGDTQTNEQEESETRKTARMRQPAQRHRWMTPSFEHPSLKEIH